MFGFRWTVELLGGDRKAGELRGGKRVDKPHGDSKAGDSLDGRAGAGELHGDKKAGRQID